MKRENRSTKQGHRAGDAVREPASAETAGPARSRRAFLRLMAAGGAAMLAAPASAAVKAPAKKPAAADSSRQRRARTGEGGATGNHPMIPAELEKQKKSTADSLKTLRNYALPPGSAPAYVFRPLAQKSRRRP